MIIETSTMPPQQYCLRWNNHRANLLTVFDELLRNESFTDVTLVCEDGVSVKCHKMVLAACSSYFQCLFSELPCRHPVVVLKDIRYADIKAILEYMYRGEVSIAQDQLAPLLKVAEALKVKGLVEENSYKKAPPSTTPVSSEEEINAISTSSSAAISLPASADNRDRSPNADDESSPSHHLGRQHHQPQQQQQQQQQHQQHHEQSSPNHRTHLHHTSSSNRLHDSSTPPTSHRMQHHQRATVSSPTESEPEFATAANFGSSNSADQQESAHNITTHSATINIENFSPPHSTSLHQTFHKSSYMYNNVNNSGNGNNNGNGNSRPSSAERTSSVNRMQLPVWPIIALPTSSPSSLNSISGGPAGFSAYESANDMPPLKRKKSIFSTNKDTPILRTVLGQGQADSSQPVSLVCHPEGQEHMPQSNGPTGYLKNMRPESVTEEAHSPQIDVTFMEEELSRQERISKMMHSSGSTSPQSFYSDTKGVSSAIANYVPTQKPEWKRYKQYTRNDIMSAIESVRNGMSALQAAKKYGVPSRTLYDKVKKLGISTQRPFRRSSGGNSSHFPYGITGSGGMVFAIGPGEDEIGSHGGMLEHGFLQQALEMGSKIRLESGGADREVMSSTASSGMVPSSHGLLQHALEMSEKIKAEMNEREAMSSSAEVAGNVSAASSSPGGAAADDRSLSPPTVKYEEGSDLSPPLPPEDNYEDQVEDLSISRKSEPPPTPSRVIMPPMNQAAATALLTACTVESARD